MRRHARRMLGILLVLPMLALAAPTGSSQDIEDVDYAFTLREAQEGNDYFWDPDALQAPAGSVVVLIYNSEGASAQHNIHVTEGAQSTPTATAILNPDEGKNSLFFTMPEEGTVTYVCDVHPQTMVGTITVGAFSTGGGGDEGVQVDHLGVHFLAHWVGVIAFAAMFILYGLTFFLFKYNETPFTTDHRDRAQPAGSGAGGGPAGEYGEPFLTPRSTVVLLMLALVVATGLLAYFLGRMG